MFNSDTGFHEKLLGIFPDRYFVFDLQGKYLSAFTSAEGMREFIVDPKTLIGTNLSQFLPLDWAKLFFEALKKVSETGEPQSFEYSLTIKEVGVQHYEARAVRMAENEIGFACRNITRRVKALARERFLSHASQLLSSSLDYQATIHNLMGLMVPALADSAVIRILNESGKVGRIEAHCNISEKNSIFHEIITRYSRQEDVKFPSSRTIREKKSILVKQVSSEHLRLASDTDEQFNLISKLGIVSSIAVPLTFDGKVLGSIYVASLTIGKTFAELDLAMLEDLAGRAAMAIQRARTHGELLRAVDLKDRVLEITRKGIEIPFKKMDQEISKLLSLTSKIDDQSVRRQIALSAKSVLRSNEEIGARLDEVSEVSQVWNRGDGSELSPQRLGSLIEKSLGESAREAERKLISVEANFDASETVVLCDPVLVEKAYKGWISAVLALMPRASVLRLNSKREGKNFVFSTMIPFFGDIESQLAEQKRQIEFTGAEVTERFIDSKTYMAVFEYAAFSLN